MAEVTHNFSDQRGPADNTLRPQDNKGQQSLSLLSIAAEGVHGAAPQPGKTTDETVMVNGDKREFAIHMPANWDGKTQLPVLYYFNGMHPDGKHEPEAFTGLSDRADRDGFAVVYMRGSNARTQTYNNGQAIFANNMDENAYLNAVQRTVAGQIPIDANHQGLAGFSQGGSEAYALAAANPWVASVQSVEGYMTGMEQPLDHPVSEQNIHALHDPIIPHNGTNQVCEQADREAQRQLDAMQLGSDGYIDIFGLLHATTCMVERNGNNIQSQSDIVNAYRQAGNLGPDSKIAVNTTTTTPDQVTRNYLNPTNGTEVRQVVLARGTHGWAGSTDHSGDIAIIGQPNTTFNASDAVSDFFLHHALVRSGKYSLLEKTALQRD
jgi:poly(3-hydroxybutyrate) depolymerase